jgi:predicted nucleic acid-binding protein
MELVIDANIAFSLLKKGSFTRELSKKHALELYSHPFILDEFGEHSKQQSVVKVLTTTELAESLKSK